MIEIFKNWDPFWSLRYLVQKGYIDCVIEKCIAYMFLAISAHFCFSKIESPSLISPKDFTIQRWS